MSGSTAALCTTSKLEKTLTMTKPRLLIPMSIQFSVRYILRTGLLDRLRETTQPVILLGWRDAELEAESKRAGTEVDHLIPDGSARVMTVFAVG